MRAAGPVTLAEVVSFCFVKTNPHPRRPQAQGQQWKMAGKLEPLAMEPAEVVEESEEAEGREGEQAPPPPGQTGGRLCPLITKY